MAACQPLHVPPHGNACPVAGERIQWSALVCMYRGGTDDLDSPTVRACMEDDAPALAADPCAFALSAKLEICGTFAQWGRYGGDAARCAADTALAPKYDGARLTL